MLSFFSSGLYEKVAVADQKYNSLLGVEARSVLRYHVLLSESDLLAYFKTRKIQRTHFFCVCMYVCNVM